MSKRVLGWVCVCGVVVVVLVASGCISADIGNMSR